MGDAQGSGRAKRKRWRPSEKDAPDNAETSTRMDASRKDSFNEGTSMDDPVLQSKHKIFLSHNGAQKDFVEQLCSKLEERHRFPFFDKRPCSLPKGERFPELILKAAQECQMAVVVVSDEYFKSRWPMIELHAFVQARLNLNTKLKILPLFYELSVEEFRDEGRRDEWFREWEDWAKVDPRINVDEWKEALKVLGSFNGIVYNREAGRLEAYLKVIASNVCKEVHADIKWDDSHVQGKLDLCEAICDKIQHIQGSNGGKVCMGGFYGVGGIGKTTICKTLCNYLCEEFEGKVSHVELHSQSLGELLKGAVKDLTNTNRKVLQELDEGKCKYILREGLHKQKIFLAIDNVWDESQSVDGAKVFLQSHFHDESVVMVTSRSLKTLISLGIKEANCFEMPVLGDEDAKRLFLQHAAYGKEYVSHEDVEAIEECVSVCYFKNGSKRGGHYLPLALKALGVQLGYVRNETSDWLKALPKGRDFNYFDEEENPVFSILRSSFDRLRLDDQSLFMDAVIFTPVVEYGDKVDLMTYLSHVHNQDYQEIGTRLRRLQERGLLEDVDMTSRTIRVHDLYREFAKLEVEGKLDKAADFGKRRWAWYEDAFPDDLEKTPLHGCWHNLTRLGMRGKRVYVWESEERKERWDCRSLQGIEWRYCSNVVVLKLKMLGTLGDLNLTALKCLRSIELINIGPLESLDGLQDLNNLTYFRWIQYYNKTRNARTRMGQFPPSLKHLILWVGVRLSPEVFARCSNLTYLKLQNCEADNLDFSTCSSLNSISIFRLQSLRTLSGLSAATNLSGLTVQFCYDFYGIPGLGHLISLETLYLEGCGQFKKLPDLQNLTRLQVLRIEAMEIGVLGCLRQLRELRCQYLLSSAKLPNLSGFEQLQTVCLLNSHELKSLEGVFVGDFPALRSLDLGDSESLIRLPDLSGMRNLEKLNLRGCGVELEEDDMRMLAALPLLQPVLVGPPGSLNYRLDVGKRKVLKWIAAPWECRLLTDSWESWRRWEERDLGMLPMKARDIQF